MTYGQCTAITVATTGIAVTLFVNGHGYWGALFVSIAVLAAVIATWLFLKSDKPANELPTLDLVLRRNAPPYLMQRTLADETGGELFQRWLRVGVLSDKQVSVRVLLESVVPTSEAVFPAHALTVMGQPGSEWVPVHAVPVAHEPTMFVDVIFQAINERSGIPHEDMNAVGLCYIANLPRRLPLRRHRIGLRIEGGGASELRHFVLDFNADGLATLAPD